MIQVLSSLTHQVIDEGDHTHICPRIGREHVLDIDCWCHPDADDFAPAVIVHNVEH